MLGKGCAAVLNWDVPVGDLFYFATPRVYAVFDENDPDDEWTMGKEAAANHDAYSSGRNCILDSLHFF
jgi:hypothetical protein